MKKRNIVIHCLVLLMLIGTFAACAVISTSESTVEYVDDSVITNKVKALLGEDDFLKQRIKGLPQNVVAGTHWATEPDMDRRFKAY